MAILQVRILKAGGRVLEVDCDKDINEETYLRWLTKGAEADLNAGMSKILVKELQGDALATAQEAAWAKAQVNYTKAKEGKLGTRARATTADGKKIPGEVSTEARRLAKEYIKNEIRAAGQRVSEVDAKELTRLANALLAADPSIYEEASANIQARKAKVGSGEEAKANAKARLESFGGVKLSQKKIEAKAKAKANKPGSATSAGKVALRKKGTPSPESHPHHA